MTFREYVVKERHKLVLGALTTAIGFFVALVGNSAVDAWNERGAYRTLLDASRAEASFNKAILEESFVKYFVDGVVLREFNLVTTNQNLTNPLFIRHASAETVRVLGQYARDLTLANAYRAKAEAIRFKDDGVGERSPWDGPLTEQWGANLKACAESIAKVTSLR